MSAHSAKSAQQMISQPAYIWNEGTLFYGFGEKPNTAKSCKIYSKLTVTVVFYSEIPVPVPPCEGPLTTWWDSDADKSIIIGTYRHGYES